jgi:hypothetical protein
MFTSYPTGSDFIMNSDQCTIDMSKINKKKELYNNNNTSQYTSTNKMLQKYPELPTYSDKLLGTNNSMKTKTNEYTTLIDQVNNHQSENHDTYVQQNNDLALLENGNKTETLIWGISSIVVIAMVVIMRNKS